MQAVTAKSSPSSERSELLDAIQSAQQATVVHIVPEAIAHGLSAHQYWPLYYVARGEATHPGRLARRLGITAPACTASLDQLVEAGLVSRRTSEEDRRQVVLSVTPKGRRLIESVWRPFDDRIREVTRDLSSDDVAVAARVLRTVADRLRAEPPKPRGAGGRA
jgi:MarR family transcriptional regulator, transcriptional regulator for hemolysin